MKTVITISRETGSGGHTIGKMLAKKLGYDFYDSEIVTNVAKKLNAEKDEVESEGEHLDKDTEYDLISGYIPYHPFKRKEKIPFEKINEAQRKLICDIAEKGKCVIIGRNADEILAKNENAFHIFVHASMEHRVACVMRHENSDGSNRAQEATVTFSGNVQVHMEADEQKSVQENRIRRELELKDKTRAAHYQYFTNRTWGMVSNYNLMIDTSLMTKTQCCELILSALEKINGGKK